MKANGERCCLNPQRERGTEHPKRRFFSSDEIRHAVYSYVRGLPAQTKKNPLIVNELEIGMTGLKAQKSRINRVRVFLEGIFEFWEISRPGK